MKWTLLSFSAGVASLLLCHELPNQSLLLGMLVAAGALCRYSRLPLLFCVGLFWANCHAHYQLAHQLPASLEKQSITVIGTILGSVKQHALGQKFDFIISQWPEAIKAQYSTLPRKIRLSWYRQQNQPNIIAPEQVWQLEVRLKRPHGLANPGGFDNEKHLFSQRIHAMGYVTKGNNHLLQQPHHGYTHWRAKLIERLHTLLNHQQAGDKVLALLTGERNQLSQQDYHILTATGTNHLLAISGLHVGFIAGLFYWLVNAAWRLSARACLRCPAQKAAAAAAILSAFIYSAIAGFATPTLRALIMISCVMLVSFLQRTNSFSDRLLLALSLILLLDPLAVMTMSFWLSFTAVMMVVYVAQADRGNAINHLLLSHCRLAIALTPLSLFFFQQSSLIAALCNIVAIPWVGFVVLPMAFIGMLLLGLSNQYAELCLSLSTTCLAWAWSLLSSAAALPIPQLQFDLSNLWALLCAMLAVLILLLPRGLPGKWLGVVWLLPCLLASTTPLGEGEVEITTLDVGQGLAMVVRTAQHQFLFDTGPGWGDQVDSGVAVISPYLRHQHQQILDTIIVSHHDMDHIGGLPSLLNNHQVNQLVSNELIDYADATTLCRAGQSWQWDGVRFHILSPSPNYQSSRNNRSCVLMIDNGYHRFLLTGDIEKSAEKQLLRRYPNGLWADVLVAPHHGSRTSSHDAFVRAVAPKWVIYPLGYLNRFRFPAKATVQTYRRHGVQQLSTADHGAISFLLPNNPQPARWFSFRQKQPRFWRIRAK